MTWWICFFQVTFGTFHPITWIYCGSCFVGVSLLMAAVVCPSSENKHSKSFSRVTCRQRRHQSSNQETSVWSDLTGCGHVRTSSDTFEHIGTRWDTFGHVGTHWDTLENTGTRWDTQGHAGTRWDTLDGGGGLMDLDVDSRWTGAQRESHNTNTLTLTTTTLFNESRPQVFSCVVDSSETLS